MTYKQGLQRNIWLYYPFNLFEGLIFSIPVWYAYQIKYMSIEQLSLVYALYSLLILVLELPTGAFADLAGRKWSMFYGWLLSGIAVVGLGFSTEYWQFISAFAVYSLGTSLVSGAGYALLYDSLKELGREREFSKQIANHGLPARLAMMSATFLGGFLYTLSPGLPFILQGISFLVLAVSILWLTEPYIDSEKFTWRNYLRQTRAGFKQLTQNNYTVVLSIYYFICAGLSWTMLTYFRLPLAYSFAFSEQAVSIFIGVGYLVTIISLISASRLQQIFTPQLVFKLTPVILVAVTLPSLVLPQIFVPLILILIQIVGSMRFTFLDSYTNREFNSKYRATAVSALNMLVSLFYFGLLLISGPVIERTSVQTFLTTIGLITFVTTIPLTIILVKSYNQHHTQI